MNNKDWQAQDDFREADCCENCKHGRAWAANCIACTLHGGQVTNTMICNSFEKTENGND